MSLEDGRDEVRRVITGRDAQGRDRRVVLQAVDGYVAMAVERDKPVFLDPLLVSRAVRDFRDLQAITLQGVVWEGIK